MMVYKVIAPVSRGDFCERLEELAASVKLWLAEEAACGRSLCHSKVFLSDAQNQYAPYDNSELKVILKCEPSTIVEQSPTDMCKIAVLIATSQTKTRFILRTLRLCEGEAVGLDAYHQTIMLFEKYIHEIGKLGLDMGTHLVRTWIYVSDIDNNYRDVVRARNDVFARHGLTPRTHFVASTGIGGNTQVGPASVAIDFLTYPDIEESDKKYLRAPDHLSATHEYGVAFERGTGLSLPGGMVYYISGTASIDHRGKVVNPGDVLLQADRLLENIEALLADGGAAMSDIGYLVVYLRDFSDHNVVSDYMKHRFPHTPYITVLGKVCRPQWLIEMECVAWRYI